MSKPNVRLGLCRKILTSVSTKTERLGVTYATEVAYRGIATEVESNVIRGKLRAFYPLDESLSEDELHTRIKQIYQDYQAIDAWHQARERQLINSCHA